MKEKLYKLLIISISIFLILTLLSAFLISIPNLVGISHLIFIIFVSSLIILVILFRKSTFQIIYGISFSKFIAITIVLTIIPRIIWLMNIDTIPFSDFKHFHDYALNAIKGDYQSYIPFYALWPFKFGYGFFVTFMYEAFGASITVIKAANVVLSIALVLEVYYIANRIFNNKTARMAAIICSLWPSQIMYTSVLASEHLFIVLFLCALIVYLRFKDNVTGPVSWLWPCLAGVLMGAAQLVRPLSTLLFVAIAVYELILSKRALENVKDIIYSLKILILILVSSIIFIFLVNIKSEELTKVPIWKSSSGINLLIGTNFESKGMFNKKDFDIVEEFNYDFEKTHSEAKKRAIERVKKNLTEYMKLLPKKFVIQWTDETYGYYWSIVSIDKPGAFTKLFLTYPKIIQDICQIWYIIVLIFSLFSCVYLIKKKEHQICIFILIIGGMVFSYLLFEVQPRYHFPAIPFLIIMAAHGINNLQANN